MAELAPAHDRQNFVRSVEPVQSWIESLLLTDIEIGMIVRTVAGWKERLYGDFG